VIAWFNKKNFMTILSDYYFKYVGYIFILTVIFVKYNLKPIDIFGYLFVKMYI